MNATDQRIPHSTQGRGRMSIRALVLCGLLLALVLAAGVSYYASGSPDGLEYVAEQVGFAQSATESVVQPPLADYEARGVGDRRIAGGLAGVAGVAVTSALAFGLFWVLRRSQKS